MRWKVTLLPTHSGIVRPSTICTPPDLTHLNSWSDASYLQVRQHSGCQKLDTLVQPLIRHLNPQYILTY